MSEMPRRGRQVDVSDLASSLKKTDAGAQESARHRCYAYLYGKFIDGLWDEGMSTAAVRGFAVRDLDSFAASVGTLLNQASAEDPTWLKPKTLSEYMPTDPDRLKEALRRAPVDVLGSIAVGQGVELSPGSKADAIASRLASQVTWTQISAKQPPAIFHRNLKGAIFQELINLVAMEAADVVASRSGTSTAFAAEYLRVAISHGIQSTLHDLFPGDESWRNLKNHAGIGTQIAKRLRYQAIVDAHLIAAGRADHREVLLTYPSVLEALAPSPSQTKTVAQARELAISWLENVKTEFETRGLEDQIALAEEFQARLSDRAQQKNDYQTTSVNAPHSVHPTLAQTFRRLNRENYESVLLPALGQMRPGALDDDPNQPSSGSQEPESALTDWKNATEDAISEDITNLVLMATYLEELRSKVDDLLARAKDSADE